MILLTEQALRMIEYSYQAVEQYNAKRSAMEDFLLRVTCRLRRIFADFERRRVKCQRLME